MTVMNNYLTEKERIIRRRSEIFKNLHRACANVIFDLKSLGIRKLRRHNKICLKSNRFVGYWKKTVQFKEKIKIPRPTIVRNKAQSLIYRYQAQEEYWKRRVLLRISSSHRLQG